MRRDRPLKAERKTLGSIVKVPDVNVRRTTLSANAGPNAPLLKRIVRYPYALHGTAPKRVDLVPRVALPKRGADPRPSVAASLAADRAPAANGNPLRAVPTRVVIRERPASVDAWLASGGAPDSPASRGGEG